MSFLLYLFFILFILICVFLILLVLIQKGRGGGLSSAFGGVGGHTAFGSKTGDVLTWATAIVFGVFLLLSIITGLVFDRVNARVAKKTPAAPAVVNQTPADAEDTSKAPNVPAQVPPPAGDPGVPPSTNPAGR